MNTTNRIYEAMFIVDSALNEQELEPIVSKYSQLVIDQGGNVIAAGKWDKRRLAYEIKGRREGTYVLMIFEGPPTVAAELDRVFRISDEVFRFLITRIEREHIDISRMSQPAGEEGVEEIEEVAEEPEEEVAEAAVEEVSATPADELGEQSVTGEPAELAEEPAAEQAEPGESLEGAGSAQEEETVHAAEDDSEKTAES